jgi:predicted MFS family arabinose efflux permease
MKTKAILSPKQLFILGIIGLTQAIMFTMPYMPSAFYDPMIQILDINNTQLGVLMSIYGVITIIAMAPGGWAADKFNTRKLITWSMVLTGIMGVVAAFWMNFTVYCILWALFSIVGNGMYWSAGMKAVRLVGDENEQGKAYGYFYAFNFGLNSAINAVGVAILAAFIAAVFLGMRYIFLYFSVVCFIVAILDWKFISPVDAQTPADEGKTDVVKEKITRADVLTLLKTKEIWLFSIIGFCCYTILNISIYFTPYFGDVMGLNVASAGLIYILTGPGSIIFGPVFGSLCDWMHSTMKLIIILMSVTVLLFVVMITYGGITLPMAIAIDILIAAIGGGAYNIMFSSVEELGLSRRLAGTCIGIASVIAYSPDAFMYILFGHWLDSYGNGGYKLIFTYSAIVSAVAVAIGIYLYSGIVKRKKKAQNLTAMLDENQA